MRVNGQNEKLHSALDQMTIQELEQLLDTPDGVEPDVDFITEVLEVVQAKEAEHPDCLGLDVDVDAAWEDFKGNYMGQAEACRPADGRSHSKQSKTSNHRFLILVRRTLTVAAVLTMFCVTASAFGFFQWFADWTAQTFRFASIDEGAWKQDVLECDPYAALRAAVAEETDLPVVPAVGPDKSVQVKLTVTERSDGVRVHGVYRAEDDEYSITLTIYDDVVFANGSSTYQKSEEDIEICQINNIEHYLMKNNESSSAAWINQNVEVHIQGEIAFEDLETMVASVYWE